MSSLALLACLGFIGWILARDHQRRRSVSLATWIPTLLLLVLGSRPVSEWLGARTYFSGISITNDAPRSPLDEAFYLTVLGGSWAVATARRVRWGMILSANRAIVMLYMFFLASIIWSSDPFGSFKRLNKDFALLFVIAVIFSEKDPLQAIRAVYFRCAAILFPLSIVFIRYFPAWGRTYTLGGEPLLTGVTPQKNTLGEIVLVFGMFLVWDCFDLASQGHDSVPLRTKWDRLALLLMAAYLLRISESKTALVCFVIALALLFVNRTTASQRLSGMTLLVGLLTPALVLLTQQSSGLMGPAVEALGRDLTFTGRTVLWNFITAKTVNPLIGAGYWNFWGGPGGLAIKRVVGTAIPSAHNGYLDIYLDGGWAGIVLLYCVLLASGKRLLRNLSTNTYASVAFAVLIAGILYNLSESMFLRISPLWFTTLLAIVQIPPQARGTGVLDHASRIPIRQPDRRGISSFGDRLPSFSRKSL